MTQGTFFDLTEEERNDWRREEATLRYLAELRMMDSEFGTEALGDVTAGRMHDAIVKAGKQEGVIAAIRLLEEET